MERKLGEKHKHDLGLGWLAGSSIQPGKRREIEGERPLLTS